jgi:HK97 family phage prohead protease
MGWDPVMRRPQRHDEIIARGAFSGATSGRDTVALRVEHSDAAPLASTRGGSLNFHDDSTGLVLATTLPKGETDVADAVSKVKRGVLSELSVGMAVGKGGDEWSDDRTRRTIRAARLAEVSLVHEAANPGAQVLGVRADSSSEYEVRYVGSLAVVETRRDYSDAEKAALGKDGKALWLDGHWAFPVNNAEDFADAVTSVGRTPGKNRTKVRKYLLALARKYGYDAPPSWASDGTVKRSRRVMTDAEIRARAMVGYRPRPTRDQNWTLLRLEAERLKARAR